jgi:acetyl esterase/lipase
MLRLLCALALFGTLAAIAESRAEPPPIEAYGRLPATDLVALSPSGQRIAMIQVAGDARTVVVSPVDGAKPLAQAPVGSAKVRYIEWAGEDHLLVFVTQTAKYGSDPVGELETVVSMNIGTGKTWIGRVSGEYCTIFQNNHWYGYFSGRRYGLWQVDLDAGTWEAVDTGKDGVGDWLLTGACKVVARSFYDSHSGDWRIVADASGGRQLASGRSQLGGPELVALGRAPDSVLIGYQTDKGYEYEEAPLSGAPAKPVQDTDDIAEVLVDPANRRWIGQVTHGDVPQIAMFDPQIEAKVAGAVRAFPGLSARLESWSQDFNRMVIHTSGNGESGAYWLVDIPSGAADPIGYDYPDIKSDDVGPIRMVDWKAADGLALRGVLTLPLGRDPRNLPLVVLPHGGPEARDHPVFDWWAQAFASRGYAVFQPNFRGSGDYGQAFRDAGFGQYGRKMQTDVSDGVAELAREGIVNSKRVCIVGASYGGYVALAGVTIQHGLYRCAVSDAGISDPRRMVHDAWRADGYLTVDSVRYWEAYMGSRSFDDSSLDAISPIRHAAEADAPILLIHGKDDTVVPIDQSERMQTALKAIGKPVEMVVMPNEDHWLSGQATRIQMLQASVAFVEKYNPPDPAPAHPAVAAAH